MHRATTIQALLLLLWLSASGVHAGEDAFEQGVSLFESGDYRQALVAFEHARKQGQSDRGLRFNIAVCHVRLQQWSQANVAFSSLYQDDPTDSLVAYNLAITEKKMGHTERAAQLFLEVSLTSAADDLAVLANRQYQRMLHHGSVSNGNSTWLASASLNLGSDSNVIDPTDESSAEQDDQFAEMIATASWYSSTDLRRAWVIDGLAYSSRYDQVDDYNVDLVSGGALKYVPLRSGYGFFGAEAERSKLGDEDYLGSIGAIAGTGWRNENGRFWSLRYRFQNISSLSDTFDPQEGHNHRIQAESGARVGALGRFSLRYQFDLDDREDLSEEGRFVSFSAQRHGLFARWSKTGPKWEALLSADYRFSRFDDDTQTFPIALDERRKDQRYRINARLAWLFTEQISISLDYSYSDNDSTIDRYDYDRNLIMSGINWQL